MVNYCIWFFLLLPCTSSIRPLKSAFEVLCSRAHELNFVDALFRFGDFRKQSRVPSEAVNVYHEIVISVNPVNLGLLNFQLHQRSDVENSLYGHHLDQAQISSIIGNHKGCQNIVKWLHKEGVASIKTSLHCEFISASAPVILWERLLETEFYEYKHISLNEIVIRSESLLIPKEIINDVHHIFNVVDMPPQLIATYAKPHINQKYSGRVTSDGSIVHDWVTPALINKQYSIVDNTASGGASQAVYETMGQSYSPSDLQSFQKYFQLPVTPVSHIIGGHSNNSACASRNGNDCGEANLDVQYMMSVAQGASTTFYYNNNTDVWLNWIIATANMIHPPEVISISYSSYESSMSQKYIEAFNVQAQKLLLQGVTLLAASGDDGVAGYQARNTPAYCGYHPQFPACSPYVTAVGGTQGPESGKSEVSCVMDIVSGGGFSNAMKAPTWQTKAIKDYLRNLDSPPVAGYSTSGRGYPDISALAHNYMTTLGGQMYGISGTSASTPVVAAMITLVNSARKKIGLSTVGWINPTLYSYYPLFVNDVTSGDNMCTASAVCCRQGFTASGGWDPVTGLGSLNFSSFKNFYLNTSLYADNSNNVHFPTPSPVLRSNEPSLQPTPLPTVQSSWVVLSSYMDSAACASEDASQVTAFPTNVCLTDFEYDQSNKKLRTHGSIMFSCSFGYVNYAKYNTTDCTGLAVHEQSSQEGCVPQIQSNSSVFFGCALDPAPPVPRSGNYYVANISYDSLGSCTSRESAVSFWRENLCFASNFTASFKYIYPNHYVYDQALCQGTATVTPLNTVCSQESPTAPAAASKYTTSNTTLDASLGDSSQYYYYSLESVSPANVWQRVIYAAASAPVPSPTAAPSLSSDQFLVFTVYEALAGISASQINSNSVITIVLLAALADAVGVQASDVTLVGPAVDISSSSAEAHDHLSSGNLVTRFIPVINEEPTESVTSALRTTSIMQSISNAKVVYLFTINTRELGATDAETAYLELTYHLQASVQTRRYKDFLQGYALSYGVPELCSVSFQAMAVSSYELVNAGGKPSSSNSPNNSNLLATYSLEIIISICVAVGIVILRLLWCLLRRRFNQVNPSTSTANQAPDGGGASQVYPLADVEHVPMASAVYAHS